MLSDQLVRQILLMRKMLRKVMRVLIADPSTEL